MAFDPSVPQTLSSVESKPVRDNLNALATHHIGQFQPDNAQDGWIWIDTSNVLNVRMRVRQNGVFKVILEHLEGTVKLPQSFIKYVHTQAIAATLWQVTHNLNTKDVVVIFYDSADQQIIPGSVLSQNVNLLQATFNVPRAGRAVVLG